MTPPPHAAASSASASAVRCPVNHGLGSAASHPGAAPRIASLADHLKEHTKAAHARAEQHPIQGRMVHGQVTRADYAAWLTQMWFVWKSLDGSLASLASSDSRVAYMLRPYHPHARRIEADLAVLGLPAPSAPAILPATARFAARISALASSPALLGIWYVLEGSANGGRFIARALAPTLGLTPAAGLSSFDPHGEQQRPRWQTWRADLDAQPWTSEEQAAITDAAAGAFDAMTALMQDLSAAAATGQV